MEGIVSLSEYTTSELRDQLKTVTLPDEERSAIELEIENRDRAARGLPPL